MPSDEGVTEKGVEVSAVLEPAGDRGAEAALAAVAKFARKIGREPGPKGSLPLVF
jgi:hypothetical protein